MSVDVPSPSSIPSFFFFFYLFENAEGRTVLSAGQGFSVEKKNNEFNQIETTMIKTRVSLNECIIG